MPKASFTSGFLWLNSENSAKGHSLNALSPLRSILNSGGEKLRCAEPQARREAAGSPAFSPFFLEGESVLLADWAVLAERGLGSSMVGRGGAAAPKASTSSSFANGISAWGLLCSKSGGTGDSRAPVGDWSLNASEDSL